VLCGVATAQESKTLVLAKELTQLLDAAKLDAIAAKDPSAPDTFVAALYFPGSQLLVVSAKYQVPVLLNDKIAKGEYKDIYTDLNSAFVEGTKCFVMDIGADGLKAKKDEARYDTCDIGSKSYMFDGDWKKQKLASEEDYQKAYSDADGRYQKMLTVLIAQAKKK
jgi:glutathionyl-hydroquinone reductase